MLRLCCVNPGYQSLYRGSWAAVRNYGSQYLQLLIKGSKWKLCITAGYKATIADECSKPAFCLTGLGGAFPACRYLWSHPFVTPSKGCWNPQHSSLEQISVSTQPCLAGTFGTGRQAAELGSVGFLFLCLFLVILSSYSCDSGTKMNVKNVGAEISLAAFVQLIAPI